MRPYRVIILLGLVLTIVTTACVGMVYFTRQADEHTAVLLSVDHSTILKRDQQLATILIEIHTLLTNGKSASALNAKAAKVNAAAGVKIITKVEGQLDSILASSRTNHDLICYLVENDNAPKALVQLDCIAAVP